MPEEPEIIIASTTQTPEELAAAFPEGTEVEEVPERPQEPERTADEREADDVKSLPRGVQRRLDRLTARLKSAEEELAKSRVPKPAEPAKAPANENAQGRPKEATETKPEPNRARSYEERAAATKARFKDWDQTFAGVKDVQVPEIVLDAIRELPNGPEVGYFLAKSPQLLDHLVKEPQLAIQRVRQMGHDLWLGSMPGARELSQRLSEAVSKAGDEKQIRENARKFPFPNSIAPAVQAALIAEENGVDVALYLGRHPELAAKFARMNPMQAYGMVVRLATELGAKAPAARPVSRAPEPIKPVTSSSPVARALNDPDISVDEYVRRRTEQISNRRRNRW
jgi:hypothetical protein